MPKHKLNGLAAQQLKAIRPFVSFNYDLRRKLTKPEKARISRYFKEIEKLQARPYQIFRTRKRKNLEAAQAFAGQRKGLKAIKVAFIPNDGKKSKISVSKKGRVRATRAKVVQSFIPLDPEKVIEQGEAYIANKIKKSNADRFSIRAGAFEIPATFVKATLPRQLLKLAMQYDLGEGKNHDFRRWLNGVNAYKFHGQKSALQYQRAKNANKIKMKKSAKLSRQRAKRLKLRGK